MAKKGAGGGLMDLLTWAVGITNEGDSKLMMVPVEEITVDRRQPRRHFDGDSLERLASSIRANGVIEPVLVRKMESGGYQLIAGERRLRAARMAGSSEIPALIGPRLTDSEIKKFQLIENLMREDLNPLEETWAYLDLLAARLVTSPAGKYLANANLLTRRARLTELLKELAQRARVRAAFTPDEERLVDTISTVFEEIGHMGWLEFVTRRLTILNLPEELLEALHEGWLSYDQARLLTRVNERGFGAQARKERQKLLAWIKRETPTSSEVSARIKELRATRLAARTPTPHDRLNAAVRRLKANRRVKDGTIPPKLRARLEKTLGNLELLVADLEKLQ